MGFDIVGVKPTKEVGKCFMANIHTWSALWHFICDNCCDLLTPEQVEYGFSNSGSSITARQAKAIVERLDALVISGKPINSDNSQTNSCEIAKLKLLELQNVFGASSSHDADEDISSVLSEFTEFARYAGGFKIN